MHPYSMLTGGLLLVAALGCGATATTTASSQQNEIATPASKNASFAATPADFQFTLTDAACVKLREFRKQTPGATHLQVNVEFDDEKYCVGCSYQMRFVENPDAATHVVMDSQVLPLAIDKADVPFLTGTTLDWVTLPTGQAGFKFLNPNEGKAAKNDTAGEKSQSAASGEM